MTNLARGALDFVLARARRARARRHRQPPRVRFGPAGPQQPRIYYLSPDPPRPRGGVRVIYQHVDLLNEAGYSARVMHRRRGYRADWFANDTAVSDAADVVVGPADILVVPEYFAPLLREVPREQPVVLFDQAPYYTFDTMSVADVAEFLARPSSSVMTVSQNGADLLRLQFAGVPVSIARPVVDPSVFHPGPPSVQRRRIAFNTSRLPHERAQVLATLERRGRLEGWELVPISGMSEAQVAQSLRSAAIFLSFSDLDGFGLPPAEAMASGCYVIGHHGGGGADFFDPRYCTPIPAGAFAEFVHAVESAVSCYDRNPAPLTAAGLDASAAVLGNYSYAGLGADLRRLFNGLGIQPSD